MFGTLKEHFFGGDVPTNAKDHELSEAMMGAWVRFATTGDPNGGGLSWPAYDPAKDNYIVFDDADLARARLAHQGAGFLRARLFAAA